MQLESSRAETADLIAATEELMLLSQSNTSVDAQQQPAVSDLARSLSRSTSGSGLKAPGFTGGYGGESRIGKVGYGAMSGGGASFSRDRSGSSSLGTRSGIMSNIERMGRGRVAE